MNVTLAQTWTREFFLDWEERQTARFEFDGARPVAITGGTAAHAAIQRNLAIAVGGRLRGTPYFAAATVIERRGDDWIVQTLLDADLLRLPEVATEVPLAELYEGIDYAADEP
jgi:hypothetical protein